MSKQLQNRVLSLMLNHTVRHYVVIGIGAATFFFGFGAGALLNIYLLFIGSPLVINLRSSFTYKSAIFGDGIILPAVNMIVAVFMLNNFYLVKKRIFHSALFLGFLTTVYFHVSQAVNGLINWAMPTSWHWNFLGLWHAVYMFSVSSYLVLFYLVLIKKVKKEKYLPKEGVAVTIGIIIFFILLRLDYITVSLSSLVPRW